MAEPSPRFPAPPTVDFRSPNPARMYDYLLGGSHNFEVDREAAERAKQANPDVVTLARANRAFLGRAVGYLLDQGIRQFLDLGSGIPTVDNVHERVLATDPDGRVAYVDNEPVAVAHSRSVLADVPLATITQADLRDVDAVLGAPTVAGLLDFSKPVGLLAVAVFHFVSDADDPAGILARYRAALAPGSYLALSHGTTDFTPPDQRAMAQASAEVYRKAKPPAFARTHAEITPWLDGLDLVEPGLVMERDWRPDPDRMSAPANGGCWAMVARM